MSLQYEPYYVGSVSGPLIFGDVRIGICWVHSDGMHLPTIRALFLAFRALSLAMPGWAAGALP